MGKIIISCKFVAISTIATTTETNLHTPQFQHRYNSVGTVPVDLQVANSSVCLSE